MTRIAFIGLGAMGAGMAARQAGAGRAVAAFDLSAPALERATAAGCRAAGSAAVAVRGAEVVITMLPAGAHVRQVWAEQVLPHAAAGALLIDCSTIDVQSARAVAGQAAAAGLRAADAPVSGGTAGADAGALTFMVGCDEADFPAVREALAPMAKAVVHAGAAGAGQAAKICNNMLLGVSMLGVCEAFALAEKLGLSPERFFEIASQSSGQCWSLNTYSPWPGVGPQTAADRGYQGGFLTALMLKDLKLAQEAAAAAGAVTPMGAQAEATFALFTNARFDWGPENVAGVLVVQSLISIIVQTLGVRRMSAVLPDTTIFMIGAVVNFLGFLAIAWAPHPLLLYVLSAPLQATGSALWRPSLTSLVSKLVSNREQGLGSGGSQASSALATIVGPMWAGIIFEQIGKPSPFLASAAIFAIAAATIGVAVRRQPALGAITPALAAKPVASAPRPTETAQPGLQSH